MDNFAQGGVQDPNGAIDSGNSTDRFENANQPVDALEGDQPSSSIIDMDKPTSEEKPEEIMDIPGTAHEKLEKLADMSKSGDKDQTPEVTKSKVEQQVALEMPTIEDRIISAQSEVIKLLSRNSSDKISMQSKEALLLSLQALAEELKKENHPKKSKYIDVILTIILVLAVVGEKSINALGNEMKSSSK